MAVNTELWAPYGEMALDDDGLAICHFCGDAFESVGNHTWQAHGIRSAEYRERVGLSRTHPLSGNRLSRHRSKLTSERIASDPEFARITRDAITDPATVDKARRVQRSNPIAESTRRKLSASIGAAARQYWSDPNTSRKQFTEGQRCVICQAAFCAIERYEGPARSVWLTIRRDTCSPVCADRRVRAVRRKTLNDLWGSEVGQEWREVRRSDRELRDSETPHGSLKKYKTYGCRCDRCRGAQRIASANHREGRQTEYPAVIA